MTTLSREARDLSWLVSGFAERVPGVVHAIVVSSDGLLVAISDHLRALTAPVDLLVPYSRGDVLAEVHREGEVISETATDDGMAVRARLDEAGRARLADFVTEGSPTTSH